MRPKTTILAGAAVSLILSAAGFAQQPAARSSQPVDWAARSCDNDWRPQPGSQGYWQWEANHNLDCAVALIDRHLEGTDEGGAGAANVTMSRQDLERLRNLIRDGKDGALRAIAERD